MWKGLSNPPAGWKEMADSYVGGVNLFLARGAPVKSTVSLVAFRVWMMGHEVLPGWLGKLSWLDRCRVWSLKLATALMLWCPGFEQLLNMLAFVLYKYSVGLVSRQLHAYAGQDFRSESDH